MAFQLATNLDLSGPQPLDVRSVVANTGERDALVPNKIYPGHIVYVTGENKYYYYNTSKQWVELNTAGSNISLEDVVYITGNQNISGEKIFKGPIGIGKNLYDYGFEIPIQSPATLQLEDLGHTELRLGGVGTDAKNTISFYDSSVTKFEIFHDVAMDSENVHFSGNDGIKINFNRRPTVNGTGVLLQGEAANGSLQDVLYTIGNSYIIVRPEDDIFTKYQEAKVLNPNNNPKSNINRSSLIIFPGIYNLTGHLDINEEFTDIIGLGAIKKDVGCIPSVIITGSGTRPGSSGFIHVSVNDVRIQGIYFSGDFNNFFLLGNALPKQVFEDCKGNNYSFSFVRPFQFPDPISIDGTFINCEGLNDSFTSPGNTHTFNGAYINCKAGNNSFNTSANTQLNGFYKNCEGGNNCFGAGGVGGILNGTFENCKAGDNSFGWGGFPDIHGQLKNCSAGNLSFGYGGFVNMSGSFFENCKAGHSSFGYIATLSGSTFINCTAGGVSWNSNGSILGKLYQCRLTSGMFSIPSGEGLLRNCIDGNNNIVDG
jgi:hypothetical protein